MANPEFHTRMVNSTLSKDEIEELAKGHSGVIKVVVDVRLRNMAAGGEWHSECRDLLVSNGSVAADCWGAKYYISTGEIMYVSQINKEKPGHGSSEIRDPAIREILREFIEKYFTL